MNARHQPRCRSHSPPHGSKDVRRISPMAGVPPAAVWRWRWSYRREGEGEGVVLAEGVER